VVAELMATTGKPIINIPDIPMGQSMLDTRERYSPIVLPSPRAAAQALDRMAWFAEYRSSITTP
jgi:hypothetical protein